LIGPTISQTKLRRELPLYSLLQHLPNKILLFFAGRNACEFCHEVLSVNERLAAEKIFAAGVARHKI
jgi:hypothetical protein